jgi:hypothetical protein
MKGNGGREAADAEKSHRDPKQSSSFMADAAKIFQRREEQVTVIGT